MKKNRTEMTPELKAQVQEIRKDAREWLIKNEIIQFRLDQNSYRNLFLIAEREQKRVGTLVREWITERVKQDFPVNGKKAKAEMVSLQDSKVDTTALAKQLKDLNYSVVLLTAPNSKEMATTEQIDALQKQIDELKKCNQSVVSKPKTTL